ncbi:MAG: ABC transporter permease [Chloroflexota bacterium]
MIFANLWRRKTRSLMTILGIAIGVAAVVALSAFGEGLATGFEQAFSSTDADLTVSQKDAIMSFLSVVDEEVGSQIGELQGVEQVVGTVVGVLQFPSAPYFIVKGEDPRGFGMGHYRLTEGEKISRNRQMLLGSTAAKNFGKNVGSTFKIGDSTYRVVGIYQTGVALEDGGAVLSLADAQSAFDKKGKVSYFNVKVKDPRRVDEVKQAVESLDGKVSVARSGESTTQAEMMDIYRSFGWFLGIFAILVGGLGMMNTMVMSVLERTREIGVLRAVGWRRRRVVTMVLGEALALALIGGALGVMLGIGLTQLASLNPSAASLLQAVYSPAIFVQAIVISLVLGAVGGLYPAWRAARLAPVEAMRYEGGAGGSLGPRMRALSRLFGWGGVRNLWRRPARTLVTVLGIGLGVGFIVALVGMTEGMKQMFTQLGGAGQADLMAEQAKASDVSVSEIDERVADRLARLPHIKSVSKVLLGVTSVPGVQFLIVFGLDPEETYIAHYTIREGRLFERPREIVIGRQTADGLKKSTGDTLHIGGSLYTIVGIYENGMPYEDSGAAVSHEDAQQLFGRPRKTSLLAISLHDPARSDGAARELEAAYPELMVTRPAKASERMQDFATTYAVLNTLILITMVVGGIVMMNTMLMSVFERTQEIGVLRALGWRRRRVLAMVLSEALALSALSAGAGLFIGVGLNWLFTLVPEYGAFMTPAYTAELFAQVMALTVALGALGGLYPAWRASGLRPIEALRYE